MHSHRQTSHHPPPSPPHLYMLYASSVCRAGGRPAMQAEKSVPRVRRHKWSKRRLVRSTSEGETPSRRSSLETAETWEERGRRVYVSVWALPHLPPPPPYLLAVAHALEVGVGQRARNRGRNVAHGQQAQQHDERRVQLLHLQCKK